MGKTAVNVAEKYEVSRADMDSSPSAPRNWRSNRKRTGFFDREIVPVSLPMAPRSPATTAPALPPLWRSSPNCLRLSVAEG